MCPECGLDYDTIAGPDTPVAVRSYPRRFKAVLTVFDDDEDPDALVRRRPDPSTWSALIYTGHVGDVFDEIGGAIRRMLDEDGPTLGFDDPDDPAGVARLAERSLDETLHALRASAEGLASLLDGVRGEAWTRTGAFPWGTRDVLTMARNAVHEGHHHLRDVGRVLDRVRGR